MAVTLFAVAGDTNTDIKEKNSFLKNVKVFYSKISVVISDLAFRKRLRSCLSLYL